MHCGHMPYANNPAVKNKLPSPSCYLVCFFCGNRNGSAQFCVLWLIENIISTLLIRMIPAYEFYSCGLHINFVSSHFQVLQEFLWTMLNLSQNYDHKLHSPSDTIHSISGCPYSANDFEFSAKQLAENAETIKVSLFPEIKLDYHSIMFSHRLNLILIHTEYILNKMTL